MVRSSPPSRSSRSGRRVRFASSSSEDEDGYVLYQRLDENGRPVKNEIIQIPRNEISRFRHAKKPRPQPRRRSTARVAAAKARPRGPDGRFINAQQAAALQGGREANSNRGRQTSSSSDSSDDENQTPRASRKDANNNNSPGPYTTDSPQIAQVFKKLLSVAIDQAGQPENQPTRAR